MTANVRVSGTYHSGSPWVRVGGVWHQALSAWARVGGVWKQIFQAISVTVNPPSISSSRSTNGTLTDTPVATGTPAGGTYSWTLVAGTALTVSGANTANPSFTATVNSVNTTVGATYQCTYTIGSVSATATCIMQFRFTGGGS